MKCLSGTGKAVLAVRVSLSMIGVPVLTGLPEEKQAGQDRKKWLHVQEMKKK